MRPAVCSDCAASVTDLRLAPNMCDKNSWVYGRASPSAQLMHHEEPPAYSLFRCMHCVAGDRNVFVFLANAKSTVGDVADKP